MRGHVPRFSSLWAAAVVAAAAALLKATTTAMLGLAT